MKFEQVLEASRVSEWASMFVDYAALKTIVKLHSNQLRLAKPEVSLDHNHELRGNDLTDKAAMYLLRLLKGQMKLMKVPADRRLHGVFLGSVDLSDNSEEIDPKILNGISTVR